MCNVVISYLSHSHYVLVNANPFITNISPIWILFIPLIFVEAGLSETKTLLYKIKNQKKWHCYNPNVLINLYLDTTRYNRNQLNLSPNMKQTYITIK